MDRGQETTEVKDSSCSRVTSATPLTVAQQVSSTSASQRVLLARERNDRNRDHLSTAFRVYKQLYGEEAAKEAFIEIAANIAKDEGDDDELPVIDGSSFNGHEGASAPRYLSYRQSLSLQKDKPFAVFGSQVAAINDPMEADAKASSQPISSPNVSAMMQDKKKDQHDVHIESSATSAKAKTPSEGVPIPNPPRYIKYRASLSTKSPATSLHEEGSNIVRMVSADASDDISSAPSGAASSSATSAAILYPTVAPNKRVADSITQSTEIDESQMPRYVRYRASLSKSRDASSVAGSTKSAAAHSPQEILPNVSSISEDDMDHASRLDATNFKSESSPQDRTAIGASSMVGATGIIGGIAVAQRKPENVVDANDASSISSVPSLSSQRYMAYRSTLKDKPWTPPLKESPSDLASQTGGIPVTEEPRESTVRNDVGKTAKAVPTIQSSGVDSDEGSSLNELNRTILHTTADLDTSLDSSVGASAETILSDLNSVAKASSPGDERTLSSLSTDASSSNVPSIAEQILRSSSESDDGMAGSIADQSANYSFADHSAATPVISNSAHTQHLNKSRQSNSNYLSYDSASSYDDNDSNYETNLVYMACVPNSPGLQGNDSASDSGDESSPAVASADVGENEPGVPRRIGSETELSQPLERSCDDADSVDESTGALEQKALNAAPSSDPLSPKASDSSDSDSSSSESSSSSSDSESSSSSSGAIPVAVPVAVASNLNTSYDSEIAVQKSSADKRDAVVLQKSRADSTAQPKKGSNKKVAIASNFGQDPADDLESQDDGKRSKTVDKEKSKQGVDSARRKRCIFAILLFLALIAALSLGVGIPLSRRNREVPIEVPPQGPTAPPATIDGSSTDIPSPSTSRGPIQEKTDAPSPSIPVSLSPTVTGGALQALLKSLSSDNGIAMLTPGTPQNRAFEWLSEDPNLAKYDDTRRAQRYSLSTFFYSTNGNNWTDNAGWGTYSDECAWFSRSSRINSCDEDRQYRNLDLGFNDVSGTLPPELGMLTRLGRVIISGGIRKTITGPLPTELGLLTGMQTFLIQGNSMYGEVPIALGEWASLETVDFSMNNFSGTMPVEVGLWRNIRFLDFAGNRFVGTVPSTIDQLNKLERLSLSDNALTGALPSTLDRLTSLKVINLEKNNITSIPTQIGNIRSLETLTLYENLLQGTLITEIGSLVALRRLSLSGNQFTGAIPAEMGSIATLRYLDLSANLFSGPIPTQIGQLSDILTLQLESNRLNGTIPTEFASLSAASLIRVDGNDITGTVPAEVCTIFSVAYPSFYSDCGNSQVVCPESCCTFCCTDGGTCQCTFIGTAYEFLCYR